MTTHARRLADPAIPTPALSHTQALHGAASLVALGTIAVPLLADRLPAGPVWWWLGLVTGVGTLALFTVFYWRTRPVSPGDLIAYRTIVRVRTAAAIGPAVVAAALYLAFGHHGTIVAGVAWSMLALAAAAPSNADLTRHQDLWDERLPVPESALWGTADPDAIAPWEDPNGGHGHGIGHHGLH